MPKILENVSLEPFNTFRIGVRSAAICEVHSEDELQALIPRLADYPRFMVLGGGSNVVFAGDYDGLIILNRITGREFEAKGDHCLYRLGGGENWHRAVLESVRKGYFGLENLSLIPGTAGAAPIQNIGAYGVELKDTFVSLRAMDLRAGELVDFDLDACQFGYRDSFFKREGAGRYCITSVLLRIATQGQLKTGYGEIEAEIARQGLSPNAMTPEQMSHIIMTIRQRKLPDPAQLPNAGSFFKNPVVSGEQMQLLRSRYPDIVSYPMDGGGFKLASGWLIDNLGWKGRSLNGARVHDRQALVLINEGGGGAAIKALSEEIRKQVQDAYGVALEPEPVWVE